MVTILPTPDINTLSGYFYYTYIYTSSLSITYVMLLLHTDTLMDPSINLLHVTHNTIAQVKPKFTHGVIIRPTL